VVAVDRTEARLVRLRQNLTRLKLAAETVVADATQWQAGPFDAVLLDAPCSSTGTIRRHPDIPWLKREGDLADLTTLQRSLLAHAIELVKPGGVLVYCTCSLEPEECEAIVTDCLTRDSRLRRRPVTAAEIGGCSEFLTADGDLRTLPCHLPDATPQLSGMDGFYAARLERL
jgi:16S rRNA (cytosine967-C5)-methyltransferase